MPDKKKPIHKLRKTVKQKKEAENLLDELYRHYPAPRCALNFSNPFELLVATILSAQCTDVRVNIVTKKLFALWPSPYEMAEAPTEELEEVIYTTGFYRNKAKAIKSSAQNIVSRFNGKVPETMEELLSLHGVARKTANVVLGNAFNKNDGVVVDTHVRRLANRFGLTRHQDPDKIEQDLMNLFPREEWTALSHLLIAHGRAACKARFSVPPGHPVCIRFGKNCSCNINRE